MLKIVGLQKIMKIIKFMNLFVDYNEWDFEYQIQWIVFFCILKKNK